MANQSKFQGKKEQRATNTYLPPIPIEKKIRELKKGEYVTVKCKTDPTSASSTTYEINVQIFSGGTPEEFLRWRKNFYRAATGQGATTGPTKFALARRLLEGGTLTAFENAAKDETTETNDTLKTVLKKVTASVFPVKSLQKQKRYMRRFFKKPGIMSIKAYVERVIEINEYLPLFPDPTSTLAADKLPDDELLDLLEFSIPRAWQKQMVLQGFDPIEGTAEEFVRFCERVEATDGAADEPEKISTNRSSDKKRGKKRAREDADPQNFYCMLHGPNSTHNTEDCWSLKKTCEAAKQKGGLSSSTSKKSEKKVWKNPANKEELNALLKFANSAAKKQKSEERKVRLKKEAEEIRNFEAIKLSDDSSNDETNDSEDESKSAEDAE